MPYKDPEKRRKMNRERARAKRAEGAWTVDKQKEADRKFVWYWCDGGKQKRLESDRRRAGALREEKLQKIDEQR